MGMEFNAMSTLPCANLSSLQICTISVVRIKKKLWIMPLLKSHIRNGFSKQGAELSNAGLHAAYFLHKWRCSFE
jgi:hypothetical protein